MSVCRHELGGGSTHNPPTIPTLNNFIDCSACPSKADYHIVSCQRWDDAFTFHACAWWPKYKLWLRWCWVACRL